jgi:hypothetical protein
MKRLFSSIFVSALCALSVFSQDVAEYGLHGAVKTFTEKSFRAELKGKAYVTTMHAWSNELESDRKFSFDEKGRIDYWAYLTDDGSEYQEETYEYNGDKLLHIHSWYNEAEYRYDAGGQLIAVLSAGHGLGTDRFFVNANGRKAEIWSVSTEGDTLMHEKLEYDAQGHLLKQYAVPFGSGEFYVSETNFVYDASGRMIQRSYRDAEGLMVYDMTYVKGRLATQTMNSYAQGMLIASEEWLFDKKGFVKQKKRYENGDPFQVNQLDLVYTQTFSYTFDKKGNWTKRVETISTAGAEGAEYFVVEREIVYF